MNRSLLYTHFLVETYVLLRVFENGFVQAVRGDGSVRRAGQIEVADMREQRARMAAE
jgi:hypothetical protein